MKIIKELIPYIIILVVVLIIRMFIITPVRVDGVSMNNTLIDGQLLILEKFDKNYKRFDIVVINYNGTKIVKRIIGLPGENVKYVDNKLYINDIYTEEPFLSNTVTNDWGIEKLHFNVIPNNYYIVLGDNRTNSTDSRIIGLINKNQILGKTVFSFFPFNRFGSIK